jgi:hypothetical protein
VNLLDAQSHDVAALMLFLRPLDDKVRIAYGRPKERHGNSPYEQHGNFPYDSVFASMPLTSSAVPFALTIDQSGTLRGSIGGAPLPKSLDASGVTDLIIGCSTAHVSFSDVTIAPYTTADR